VGRNCFMYYQRKIITGVRLNLPPWFPLLLPLHRQHRPQLSPVCLDGNQLQVKSKKHDYVVNKIDLLRLSAGLNPLPVDKLAICLP